MTLAEDQRLNTLLFSLLKRLDQAQEGMEYLMPVHDPLKEAATALHWPYNPSWKVKARPSPVRL
jgi:hypothetical protein